MAGQPDPKPPERVRDKALMKTLHLEWRECALAAYAEDVCVAVLSLHHVLKHPRDDLRENLAMLCGSGTTGHHGKMEAHDHDTEEAFAAYLLSERTDTLLYLGRKLGGQAAVAWIDRLAGVSA